MIETLKTHESFMKIALDLAEQAKEEGEVPVGAVIVYKNMVIGKGYNQTEKLKDATAHAEMIAITAAAEYLNSKYLKNCTLYVSLEPCLMCGGAAMWSQLEHIVFGATDTERGCISTGKHLLPKKTKIITGILEEQCSSLVKQFFLDKRS